MTEAEQIKLLSAMKNLKDNLAFEVFSDWLRKVQAQNVRMMGNSTDSFQTARFQGKYQQLCEIFEYIDNAEKVLRQVVK